LVARLGGAWHSGVGAGAFLWFVANAGSVRGKDINGRLLYVPQSI